ncbi:MAG: Fic family protein, partial [Oscillospiraceae bacterium]
RTLMNYYLMTHGHPPIVIYDEDKVLYYESLEKYDMEETLDPLCQFLQYETERTWQTQLELSNGQKRQRPNMDQCR